MRTLTDNGTNKWFCTCDSGVARCQSQHRYHFWRMSLMLEKYCAGKLAWQLSVKSLDSSKNCFKNVNIQSHMSIPLNAAIIIIVCLSIF